MDVADGGEAGGAAVAEAEKRGEEDVKEDDESLLLALPRTIARTELPLIEEMILLYAKLKKDEKVLRLFIFGLRDHAGAAEYCLHVAKENAKVQAAELLERVVRESKREEGEEGAGGGHCDSQSPSTANEES